MGPTNTPRSLLRQCCPQMERTQGNKIKVGDVHVVSLGGELDMNSADGLPEWFVEIAGSPVVGRSGRPMGTNCSSTGLFQTYSEYWTS